MAYGRSGVDCTFSFNLYHQVRKMTEKVMNRTSLIIWLILVSLTLFSFLLGWWSSVNETIVMILLLVSLIKGQLIIDYFMGLHHVQLKWRLIPTLWLVLIILLIGLSYFLPINT